MKNDKVHRNTHARKKRNIECDESECEKKPTYCTGAPHAAYTRNNWRARKVDLGRAGGLFWWPGRGVGIPLPANVSAAATAAADDDDAAAASPAIRWRATR